MITLDTVKSLLLKPVVFMLNDKAVRRGKLLLFHQADYYIKFTIQTNKNTNKTYEVPYPYKIYNEPNRVIFSYLISDFCKKNVNKEQFLTSVTPTTGVNKIHDRRLTITVIDDG